jgi:hypothetical protein
MTLNPEKPEDILRAMEASGDLHVDEKLGTNEDAHGPFFERLAGIERSDNVTELFEAAYSLMMDTVMEYPLDKDGYVNQKDFEGEVTNMLGDVIMHIEKTYSSNHPHVITTKKEILQSLVRELEVRDKQNTKDLRPRLAIGYLKEELRKLIAEEYMEVDSREIKTESRSLPEDVKKILFSFDSLVGGFKQFSNNPLSPEEKSEIRGIVDTFLSEQYEQNPTSLHQALKVMKEEQEEAMNEDVDGRWDEVFERIDAFCDIRKLDVGQEEDDDEEDDNWWRS